MIRLGILDFDTSHVVEFTKRLNHVGIAEDQWVQGARVVVGCPGESQIMPERIPGYRREMEKLGVRLVDRPEDMIGKVDGMLVESQEGGVHWRRAGPFLEAGLPCFVDKPFTCGVGDARRLADLAARKKVPLFSASALRYGDELVPFAAESGRAPVVGAVAYGPAPLHDRNPGLFHYGIHAVEMLYTLLGPGCRQVTCAHERGADVVTGQWRDGRLGTVRGSRQGKGEYGFVAFTEHGTKAAAVSGRFIYRDLLKHVVAMFETKRPPVPVEVTVEIVAFIEAALASAANHGTVTPIRL